MHSLNQPVKKPVEDFISLIDLMFLCLTHWRWFLLSLTVTVSFTLYKLSVTPKMYTRRATVLVKQETGGKNVSHNLAYQDVSEIGVIQQTTNLNNIVRHLSSLDVLSGVAKRLNLSDEKFLVKAASVIRGRLKVRIGDEKSTIINLEYTDKSVRQADQVLSTLVEVYNEKWIAEKNQIARSASRFIKDRMIVLEKDLNMVDANIADFKSEHRITSLDRVSDMYLQRQNSSDNEILQLNNQKNMAVYIREILSDNSKHQFLLSNSGLGNNIIEQQISEYNSLLQQYNSHMAYTSEQNPLMINVRNELDHLRDNILHSIDNHIETVQIQLRSIEGYNVDAESKIVANPEQAKHLATIQREQNVKENLYLFLLQKYEENEISMTYNSEIMQLIDVPNGSEGPTSPTPVRNLLVAIMAGLFIPVVILFVTANLDSSVRDKADVETRTSIPIVGEIPQSCMAYSKRRKWLFWKKKSMMRLVVEQGKKDIVNEAFRVIRSNLEFMSSDCPGKDNIYILTSFYPGAGKTFVSNNLATVVSIKGRRVLLIDGDLRHASTSSFWGSPYWGISNYLNGKIENIDKLLIKPAEYPNLHILPVGSVPPNPTELLHSDRLQTLLEQLRTEYDYIFIDCPPVLNMADVPIWERYVDRTIFVVRVGLSKRSFITDLDNDFQSNRKYKHLSLLLNGTDMSGHYGYRYGYNMDKYYGSSS